MAATTIKQTEYKALLRDVLRLNETADSTSSDAKLKAYWAIGKRISKLRLSEKAGYHNSVIRDLAADSGLAIRTLHQSVKFFGEYKRVPDVEGLSWSHYRVLLKLPTKKERQFYIEKVREAGWSSRQLAAAIASGLHSDDGKKKRVLPRPQDQSYVYQADVLDVIDGDTLDLDCDLGFGVARKIRVRFAKIDAAPLTQAQGRKARDFVARQLMQARSLVVKTEKSDMYGRYIVHVFFTKRRSSITNCFEQGTYLNDLLLQEKHAVLIG